MQVACPHLLRVTAEPEWGYIRSGPGENAAVIVAIKQLQLMQTRQSLNADLREHLSGSMPSPLGVYDVILSTQVSLLMTRSLGLGRQVTIPK